MFLGEPIFYGENCQDQLSKIVAILGSPSQTQVMAMCKFSEPFLPQVPGTGLEQKFGDRASPEVLDV
jgi:hypothetical protein